MATSSCSLHAVLLLGAVPPVNGEAHVGGRGWGRCTAAAMSHGCGAASNALACTGCWAGRGEIVAGSVAGESRVVPTRLMALACAFPPSPHVHAHDSPALKPPCATTCDAPAGSANRGGVAGTSAGMRHECQLSAAATLRLGMLFPRAAGGGTSKLSHRVGKLLGTCGSVSWLAASWSPA